MSVFNWAVAAAGNTLHVAAVFAASLTHSCAVLVPRPSSCRRFSSLSTDLKWANISSATAPAAAAASAIATSLPDLINTCMSPSYRTSASASSKLHEGTTAVFLAGGDSEYKTNAQLPGASLGGLPSAFWTDSTSEDATSCSTTANNDAGADVIGGSGSDQGQCHDTDASPDYLAGPAPGPAGPSRTAGKKMLATAAGMVNRSVNKIKVSAARAVCKSGTQQCDMPLLWQRLGALVARRMFGRSCNRH